MRLLPSDPDISTIVARIRSGDINLQPEFQRGEVWSKVKKQRLIDSILRDWHVPPIHVIENPDSRLQEVLDGQQRLAAIRDFVDGMFPVDGGLAPLEPAIQALNGKFYRQLPDDWRRRFDQFTIRVFRIVDYNSSEPAELFFRLNQPASLTGAEQRNAFFGPVRGQIKGLVALLESQHLDKAVLSFSNARMAYDDVLARAALAIERQTIADKITSSDLTDLYRADKPLAEGTVNVLKNAIWTLAGANDGGAYEGPKFNKATLFSWIMFLVRISACQASSLSKDSFRRALFGFEEMRRLCLSDPDWHMQLAGTFVPANRMFAIYDNRSAARVADVSSVILRDAVIWLVAETVPEWRDDADLDRFNLARLHNAFSEEDGPIEEDQVARVLVQSGWGDLR